MSKNSVTRKQIFFVQSTYLLLRRAKKSLNSRSSDGKTEGEESNDPWGRSELNAGQIQVVKIDTIGIVEEKGSRPISTKSVNGSKQTGRCLERFERV